MIFQRIVCNNCKKSVKKIECYNVKTKKHFGNFCFDCMDVLILKDPELKKEFNIVDV